MKTLLIGLLCLAVASAANLGAKRCTWGPSYWCQHIGTAKECNAVSHCITVWKNNKQPPVKSTESCLICKGLIQDLKTILASKPAESEVQQLALKACSLLHNEKTAQEVCDTVVTMFLPEVIQMIEKELDENTICSAVGLCGKKISMLYKIAPLMKKMAVKDATTCEECKLGVSFVNKLIAENSTQQEVMKFLTTEVCSKFPNELSKMCVSVVQETLPDIFESIETTLSDTNAVCAFLKLCPSKYRENLIKKILLKFKSRKLKANPVECDLCEAGINDIREALRKPDMQQKVEDFLKKDICPHLGNLAVTCSQAVSQYLPVVFQLLVTEMDPKSVCQGLNLCSKSFRAHKLGLIRMRPAKPVTALKYPSASPVCLICEFVMREVDSLIGSNRSEEAVKDALEKVCSILPSTIKSECDSFVDKYTDIVVKLITNSVGPKVVCTAIGLCAGETERQVVHKKSAALETCDLMMRYVRVLLKTTRMEVAGVLQSVCNFLPRNDRHTCRKFSFMYKMKLERLGRDAILHPKFSPKTACKNLEVPARPNGLVHLVGRSKCTYGPSYWCDNYTNAAICGAVSHCMAHVWRTSNNL